ncbi:MAG TPA: hypothetical protein VGN01_14295 [Acidobacteriaceae bacterium]|jgi:hypothetical protein
MQRSHLNRGAAHALLLIFLFSAAVASPFQTSGQHYGAIVSSDLVHWTDALSKIDFPAGMRHGSFLRITQAEYDRLAALTPSEPLPL